jgi:hypothetical protein
MMHVCLFVSCNPQFVISIPPGSSSFVDLLGPPVEQSSRADALALLLEHGTAGELLVDQGSVAQWSQVLGGLQFRGIGRQKEQVGVLRHPQMDAGVPASAIEHEHDLLGGTGPHLTCKLSEFDFEERDADGRG